MAEQQPKKNQIVIYGSYGYTGQLISDIASRSEKNVILSGRSGSKLRYQSKHLGLPYLQASLENTDELDKLLNETVVVIHCAGPFHQTWKPVLNACIRNHCHYLDITGEIEVFEAIKARNNEISEAGIMAMPGTGFDVVPTDCLSLFLKKNLPDAVNLELAFMGLGGGVSHGTAQTMADNLGKGGTVRENGIIKSVKAAYRVKEIDFGKGKKTAVSIPWGDVSTANYTTGIKNIIVYTAMKKSAVRFLKLTNFLAPVLRVNMIKKQLKKWISRNVKGPDEDAREKGKSVIWGRAENERGDSVEARLITPEGYKLTAETSWLIAEKVMIQNFRTGYQTPAAVYGEDLIHEIEGIELIH